MKCCTVDRRYHGEQSRKTACTIYPLNGRSKKYTYTYFENGMIGTGRQPQEQIARAAEEADLSKNQVGVGLTSLS